MSVPRRAYMTGWMCGRGQDIWRKVDMASGVFRKKLWVSAPIFRIPRHRCISVLVLYVYKDCAIRRNLFAPLALPIYG